MKQLGIVSIALVLLLATAIAAYEHYSVQQLPPAKPSPKPQPRAVIAVDTTVPSPSPQVSPEGALASFPGPNNDINAIIAAPGDQRILVLTGNGENEAYSLKINLVDLHTKVPKTTEIVTGSNAVDFTTPVWSADSKQIYYNFDNEGCERGVCGIYALDLPTAKSRRLINRPTVGLAVSPAGRLLAFWDYSLGDVLTVYSIPKKEVVRRWEGQTHSAGEFFLEEMAFAIDGKSLLAVTSEERRVPLKEFNLETGDIRIVSENAPGGPVLTPSGIYFVEADEYREGTSLKARLMTLVRTGGQPERMIANFPYSSIQTAGDPRWIAASLGSQATLLCDTQTRSGRTAGPNCLHAVMLSDGRVIYGINGSLVEDAKVCGTPAPETVAF